MELLLRPTPPFDFHLSAMIFSGGDRQIRRCENGRFWQVLRTDGKLTLASVTSIRSVDDPWLTVDLRSEGEITERDRLRSGELISIIFNLDLDLEQFYADVRGDEVMARITRTLRGLRSPRTPTVYEALIESIAEQQISLNVAHSMESALIKTFGDVLNVDGKTYYAFPTPERLATATVDDLRKCRLSTKKSEYIIGLSKQVAEGHLDLDSFKGIEDTGAIVRELDSIRGIGPWTAEMTALRGMGRFDAFPADDVGTRGHIALHYGHGERMTSKEARAVAEGWGRWKGLSAFYLIIADRLNLKA